MIPLIFGLKDFIFTLLELPCSPNIKAALLLILTLSVGYSIFENIVINFTFYLWKLMQIVCCCKGTNDKFVERTTGHVFGNKAEPNALKEINCRLVYPVS
jgi:hypothetical protein